LLIPSEEGRPDRSEATVDKSQREAGFTIIEILIVVAIVAILTTIVLPVYEMFSRRAEATEALYHIRTISTHQRSHKVTDATYLVLQKNPPGDPPAHYQAWGNPGGNWDILGYSLHKKIRYQYSAEAGDTGNIATSFKITAKTDFDGQGHPYDTWELDSDKKLVHVDKYK
jgi:prepilin-type N-terminal cleavage/methylation domain-containing protein